MARAARHRALERARSVQGAKVTICSARRPTDKALHLLERRIELFTMLPFASLDRMSLHSQLATIGSHT